MNHSTGPFLREKAPSVKRKRKEVKVYDEFCSHWQVEPDEGAPAHRLVNGSLDEEGPSGIRKKRRKHGGSQSNTTPRTRGKGCCSSDESLEKNTAYVHLAIKAAHKQVCRKGYMGWGGRRRVQKNDRSGARKDMQNKT